MKIRRRREICVTGLEVSGDKIRGQFRPVGEKETDWKDAGECTLPAKGEPKASLQVYQGPPGADRWARFTAFLISGSRNAEAGSGKSEDAGGKTNRKPGDRP